MADGTSADSVRVLLVDDDIVDRGIVKRALRSTGQSFAVSEADTADAAMALLTADPAAFDCGLFDLHLPGRDGRALLAEMRADAIDMPVIFLTGQGSEETAVELMKSGASDYLPKSTLSPARLSQSIGQALRLARTERAQRNAERALRESEASFRRLADHMPDAVVRFNQAGRHLYMNRRAPWTRDDGIGRTIAESGCEPANIELLESALARALAGDATQVTLPFSEPAFSEAASEAEAPDDARRGPDDAPLDRSALRARGERWPSRMTVLAIARDVTAEVDLREDEQRRTEFERQLIGIVSHDLRSPIGAILMAGSLLKRRYDEQALVAAPDTRIARILDLLETSGLRAKRMVADILDFTKARLGGGIPMVPAECDLGEVAAQLVTETRASHPGREVELIVEGSGHGYFDADRVAQAMSNLLVNAITYSAPGEPVEMVVRDTHGEVLIEVRNRGATIAPDILPMLFKPFQRGPTRIGDRDVTRSVGLGLFIVEQIVQGHRGRIEVTSGDGLTSFRMILPRRSPSARMRAVNP